MSKVEVENQNTTVLRRNFTKVEVMEILTKIVMEEAVMNIRRQRGVSVSQSGLLEDIGITVRIDWIEVNAPSED